MSKFVYYSKENFNKEPNRKKNHKFQERVLVEEDEKVVRRGADVIPVFVFTHANFPDKQIHDAKQLIHVTQEVTEEIFFVLVDDTSPVASDGFIDGLWVGRNNSTVGAEANDAPNLLSGRTSN